MKMNKHFAKLELVILIISYFIGMLYIDTHLIHYRCVGFYMLHISMLLNLIISFHWISLEIEINKMKKK